MKIEYSDFFKVLSHSLHGEQTSNLDVDWNFIYDEAKEQAIVPLLIGTVGISPISDKKDAMAIFMGNLKLYEGILKEQNRLDSILSSNGVKYAALKGIAAAQYYPHPEYRTYGDIDIIIEKDKFSEAQRLLISEGYNIIEDFDKSQRHIGLVGTSGIEIEAHIKFSGSHDDTINANIDNIISCSLKKTVKKSSKNLNFSVLPEIENGVVLIDHINQHMYRGLGIRQIIDWMYYVENVVTDDLWENNLSSILESIGLKKLALVTTSMCTKYLGLKSEAVWVSSYIYDSLVDELAEYLIKEGNFGRKTILERRRISAYRALKNPLKGVALAQERGVKHWKMQKKYPMLRSFSWIYHILKWLSQSSKNKFCVSDVISADKKSKKLMEQLELTRTDEL